MECKFNLSSLGSNQEVTVALTDYRQANDVGMSMRQFLNARFPTDARDPGLAFDQMAAQVGLIVSENRDFGLRCPTIFDLMSGTAQLISPQLGTIVRPDGSDNRTAAGGMLFPALLMDVVMSALQDDHGTYASVFGRMVAGTRTITTPKYERVIVNITEPQQTRPAKIAQLAEPKRLLSLTTSDVSRSIGVDAIGIEFSDQALRASTLDFVRIALEAHSAEERARRINEDFLNIVNGDVDSGEDGILSGAPKAQDFDSSIASAGVLTQKAWVKYLYQLWERRRINFVVCNIDSYLAIEGRTGRPTKEGEPAVDERLNTLPTVNLPLIPGGVQIFIMDDMPANTLVGLDNRYAIQRVVYVSAEYAAVEAFVMRRTTAMRFDTAERNESMGYAEAFAPLTLTV